VARAAAGRLLGVEPATPARVMLNHRTSSATVTIGAAPPVEVELAMDCRYAGQSHELTVPTAAAFEDEHRRRNGYARPGAPVEVTALRAAARLPAPVPLERLPAPAASRQPARGPAVLAEPDCTVWIPPGWTAEVGPGGSWLVTR
jgi:N-methylhydantoinase A/oxoprolinase/acetone carboxylase beta subunit